MIQKNTEQLYKICVTTLYLVSFLLCFCLLYKSDAADEEDSVDLGGRRIS